MFSNVGKRYKFAPNSKILCALRNNLIHIRELKVFTCVYCIGLILAFLFSPVDVPANAATPLREQVAQQEHTPSITHRDSRAERMVLSESWVEVFEEETEEEVEDNLSKDAFYCLLGTSSPLPITTTSEENGWQGPPFPLLAHQPYFILYCSLRIHC
jgi:hypothetical protein